MHYDWPFSNHEKKRHDFKEKEDNRRKRKIIGEDTGSSSSVSIWG